MQAMTATYGILHHSMLRRVLPLEAPGREALSVTKESLDPSDGASPRHGIYRLRTRY
jgi:hypothetical protein